MTVGDAVLEYVLDAVNVGDAVVDGVGDTDGNTKLEPGGVSTSAPVAPMPNWPASIAKQQ